MKKVIFSFLSIFYFAFYFNANAQVYVDPMGGVYGNGDLYEDLISNQTSLATGRGIIEFLKLITGGTLVLKYIDGESERQYQEYKRQTTQNMNNSDDPNNIGILESCERVPKETANELGEMIMLYEAVRNNVCGCHVWGTCPKNLCSCERQCPRDFRILERPEMRGADITKPENSLTFLNSSRDFEDSLHPMTQGYCWGHSAVTQSFNRLAFFKPNDRDGIPVADTPAYRRFYERKIDDILSHKATAIPGFANLHDFSEDPTIQEILKEKVARTWAHLAVDIDTLRPALRTSNYNVRELNHFQESVKERIDMGQRPQLIFTMNNHVFESHVVQVNRYKTVDGKLVMCLEDSNAHPQVNYQCGHTITVGDNGQLFYNTRYNNQTSQTPITGARVTYNEDRDALAQMHSLADYCLREKSCPIR